MTEEKAIAIRDEQAALLERVVIHGDLSKLSEAERVVYYRAVCESIGVNPLTRPFDYLTLNNKQILYANRNCTDQLRANRHISVAVLTRERIEDVYVVTARATDPSGRSDESIGAVAIGGLKGNDLANALMKAESKSKRRATLSLVGLSMLDETEIETIKDARRVTVEELQAPPAAGYLKPELPAGYIAPDPGEALGFGPDPEAPAPLSEEQAELVRLREKFAATVIARNLVPATVRKRFAELYQCQPEAATVDQLLDAIEKLEAKAAKAVAP